MRLHRRMVLVAVVVILSFGGIAQAGLISSIRDKITGGEEQPQPAQQQYQQQPQAQGQVQQAQGTPPPAEKPVDKRSKAEIKASAAKLKQELNWERPPADLFQRYAGKWKGQFWVYSPLGRKEEFHKVEITYVPRSDGSMTMETHSLDAISNQWIVEESAVYTISGDTINVTITRPNGSISKQIGHYSDNQLFLQAQINDGVEHFRERIDGKRLLVDGFGVYGGTKSKNQHIFIGRFLKE